MIVQKLKSKADSSQVLAERYFTILSALNGFRLTHIATSGGVVTPELKEGFCSTYKTTVATVNNLVYSLKNLGLLVKGEGRIIINPVINLNFEDSLTLEISMHTNGHAKKEVKEQENE